MQNPFCMLQQMKSHPTFTACSYHIYGMKKPKGERIINIGKQKRKGNCRFLSVWYNSKSSKNYIQADIR
jgi:hypothetical protein